MTLKMFALAAITFTLAIQCKKSSVEKIPDYSPLTAGSSWTYQNNPGNPYTITATNRDTVAAGKTYRVLNNSGGANNYLSRVGNDYYRFGSFSSIGLNAFEELYLKDNQPLNTTWTITQNITVPNIPIPLTVNLIHTINAIATTRTVAVKSYSNVIHVKIDITITGLGSVGAGNFYYAEGVGMIENSVVINIPGQVAINQTQQLTAYTIR